MLVVYIAGPYRSGTVNGILANIAKAREEAAFIWKCGAAALCPHMNTALMDGVVKDEMFLSGDVELLSRCDVAYFIDVSTDSEGCKAEARYCKDNFIPVFRTRVDIACHIIEANAREMYKLEA